jgi:hypothetical protein
MMQGKIQTRAELKGKVAVGTGSAPVDIPVYEGAYVVTPAEEDIVLQTADKLLEENITVKAVIPEGDAIRLQKKSVTPTDREQIVAADAGYNALSEVVVASVMDTPFIEEAYNEGYEKGLSEGGGTGDIGIVISEDGFMTISFDDDKYAEVT